MIISEVWLTAHVLMTPGEGDLLFKKVGKASMVRGYYLTEEQAFAARENQSKPTPHEFKIDGAMRLEPKSSVCKIWIKAGPGFLNFDLSTPEIKFNGEGFASEICTARNEYAEVIIRLNEKGIAEVWLTPYAVLSVEESGLTFTRRGEAGEVLVSCLSEKEAQKAIRWSIQPDIQRFGLGEEKKTLSLPPDIYQFAVRAGEEEARVIFRLS